MPLEEFVMMSKSIAVVVAALCVSVPVYADEAAPDTAEGRYVFEKQAAGQADSYLRLDTQTGEVAMCSPKAVGWACEAAAEDRAVLEDEITRLRSENAALKKAIVSRGLPLPAGVMPEPLAQNDAPQNTEQNTESVIRLPSDADIDRMMSFVDHVWHRFVEAVERAQKQVFNKS
jgi:hypothetical protein